VLVNVNVLFYIARVVSNTDAAIHMLCVVGMHGVTLTTASNDSEESGFEPNRTIWV
jgi:hypothetical protein